LPFADSRLGIAEFGDGAMKLRLSDLLIWNSGLYL